MSGGIVGFRGPVVVVGGGDLGTGVAHRLHCAGYRVVVLEKERPTVVRRAVSFAQAALDGSAVVEEVEARRESLSDLERHLRDGSWPGHVPVLVDPEGESIGALTPSALVDARLAKVNLGTRRDDAGVTIGLGPGFTAVDDVDYVVETMRGHSLGRLIAHGSAAPDTGVPAAIAGVGEERGIRAPAPGHFHSSRSIGEIVDAGDVVGRVGGAEAVARIAGLLRGLVANGTEVGSGQKLGDVDPRGREIDHTMISDKARAVAGAVLEGLLRGGVLPDRFISAGSPDDV